MIKNEFIKCVNGYNIIRDGYIISPEDVCILLYRLDILEKERLKMSNNKQIAPFKEIERLQNENEKLIRCIVDCINLPKGVIPDSVINLNKGQFWNEPNTYIST